MLPKSNKLNFSTNKKNQEITTIAHSYELPNSILSNIGAVVKHSGNKTQSICFKYLKVNMKIAFKMLVLDEISKQAVT